MRQFPCPHLTARETDTQASVQDFPKRVASGSKHSQASTEPWLALRLHLREPKPEELETSQMQARQSTQRPRSVLVAILQVRKYPIFQTRTQRFREIKWPSVGRECRPPAGPGEVGAH